MDRELVVNDSSHISRLGWNPDTNILVAEFTSGFVYRYVGVTPALFGLLCQADSVGVVFNEVIRSDKSIAFSQLGGWPEDNAN